MTISNIGGGSQIGDGNLSETVIRSIPVPATATSTATLTVAQVINGILLGSPGSSAASYTLPTGALMDATLGNAKVGSSFDFNVVNVDGSGSGVITLLVGTGWTFVGLATVVATAGTAQGFRARRTGTATWTLYRIS